MDNSLVLKEIHLVVKWYFTNKSKYTKKGNLKLKKNEQWR